MLEVAAIEVVSSLKLYGTSRALRASGLIFYVVLLGDDLVVNVAVLRRESGVRGGLCAAPLFFVVAYAVHEDNDVSQMAGNFVDFVRADHSVVVEELDVEHGVDN